MCSGIIWNIGEIRRVLKTFLYGEEEEKERLLAEIEENSWEYGRTLVPQYLLKAYDQVRELDKLLLKENPVISNSS